MAIIANSIVVGAPVARVSCSINQTVYLKITKRYPNPMSSAKRTAIKERQTKAQIVKAIAEETGLTNKDVKAVLVALAGQAERHLKPRGVGVFVVPELGVKMKTVKKKATKARPGRNPFTGEEIMIKAKPASTSVRAVALKAAKDFATS